MGKLKATLEWHIDELHSIDFSLYGLNLEQENELRINVAEFNVTLARIATWWCQRAKFY